MWSDSFLHKSRTVALTKCLRGSRSQREGDEKKVGAYVLSITKWPGATVVASYASLCDRQVARVVNKQVPERTVTNQIIVAAPRSNISSVVDSVTCQQIIFASLFFSLRFITSGLCCPFPRTWLRSYLYS